MNAISKFGMPIDGTPPSAELITEKVQAYCRTVSDGDVDGILNLFAKDVLFFEPVGQAERTSHKEIREFFQSSAGKVELKTEGAIRISGFYAAAPMRARAHGFGPEFFVDTLDIFVFDEAGKFREFYAVWGPTNNPSPNTQW